MRRGERRSGCGKVMAFIVGKGSVVGLAELPEEMIGGGVTEGCGISLKGEGLCKV